MTSRGKWLVLLGIVGLAAGLWRDSDVLALLSLTILLWVFVEWLWLYARIWLELPRLEITRSVNGRSDAAGILWAGRRASVEVGISCKGMTATPILIVHDCVPEHLHIVEGERQQVMLTRVWETSFQYTAQVNGAGRFTIPGFKVTFRDPHGFFAAERFVEARQTFRVLPGFATIGESQPIVKRLNTLPQHGIHRLQRAGLGSELLELREYAPGDPPKSIAWKVSARRETLMTRQYESEVPVRVTLFVDGSISTRVGGYGQRLLDQMLYVAATVARTSISVGDPVGAVLFDEKGQQRVQPTGGERGFYRLLEAMADFAVPPPAPRDKFTTELLNAAERFVGEQHSELLDPAVNQVPFFFLPISPWKRQALYRRSKLAAAIAELHGLTPLQQVEMIHDDQFMAAQARQLLTRAGVAWMDPMIKARTRSFNDGLATMELLGKAISRSVLRARDNEVYVVFANLLECATNISRLLPALKMAIARHHRVMIVCPTATFQRPDSLPELNADSTTADMLLRAEQLRTRELSNRLTRSLRRIGATCSLSGQEQAIPMIFSETELARSGRTRVAGAR